jgi:hypothetical protein
VLSVEEEAQSSVTIPDARLAGFEPKRIRLASGLLITKVHFVTSRTF